MSQIKCNFREVTKRVKVIMQNLILFARNFYASEEPFIQKKSEK